MSHHDFEVRKLENTSGGCLSILNYGARITAIELPSNDGLINVVLGYQNPEAYLQDKDYHGATIGRYGNRLEAATFELDGQSYKLAANEGRNQLHGGYEGFHKQFWEFVDDGTSPGQLQLRYFSPHGEEGFPGNLEVEVNFNWSENHTLTITYKAKTDRPSIVNLTNHSYFNLKGAGSVLDHAITLPAQRFTPVSSDLIPTGEIKDVDGTAFDLRVGAQLFRQLEPLAQELIETKGFDHNFELDQSGNAAPAAIVSCPNSPVSMHVITSEPGLQFYTGQHLTHPFQPYGGLCLETQNFPDAPNHPNFPKAVLRPGETYQSQTQYAFDLGSSLD